MLVLMRRGGESVRIGDGVMVTVLGDRREQVRRGIGTPNDVPVHRGEVHDRIREALSRDGKSRWCCADLRTGGYIGRLVRAKFSPAKARLLARTPLVYLARWRWLLFRRMLSR